MTDVGIDTGVPETPATPVPGPAGNDPVSIREAARSLGKWRHDPSRKPQEPKEESRPVAEAAPSAPAPEQESTAQAEDAAPPVEATGETQETDPASQPPLDLPRSWTKEQADHWNALPRATQEYLTAQASKDSEAVRRSQNEAAEARKAIEAERSKVEQARQQFETALPQVLALLNHQATTEFADIQSDADVDRLAREDWPRYIQWQRHREKTVQVFQQMQTAQQHKQAEEQTKFAEFAREQGEKFREKVPDMADPVKATELQKDAVASLKGVGFAETELAEAWAKGEKISFHDYRVQLVIHKAALWDKAQAKAKTVVNNAKPIPPVQRPGAAQPKGAAQAATIENLGKKLDGASGVRNQLRAAADLVKAKRASR